MAASSTPPGRAPHGRPRDPSSVPNLFATRLSDAIAARGLSLQRIQVKLADAGLSVSVATLSYWSSGRARPRRTKSLAAVQSLETILHVEDGWLTSALPAERVQHDIAQVLTVAQGVFEQRGQASVTSAWRPVLVHYILEVDEQRHEHCCTTRQISQAERDQVGSWINYVKVEQDCEVRCEAISGARIGELVHSPSGDLSGYEMVLPSPLARGEMVCAEHRTVFGPTTVEADTVGYAVTRTVETLVLEVRFADQAPATVTRCFTGAGGKPMVELEHLPVVDARACSVIASASPGVHRLVWQW